MRKPFSVLVPVTRSGAAIAETRITIRPPTPPMMTPVTTPAIPATATWRTSEKIADPLVTGATAV